MNKPVKFDAAFLNRRLHEHKLWRERENLRLIEEVLDEAADAILLRRRKPMSFDFESAEAPNVNVH
jgi:hypothetical protein